MIWHDFNTVSVAEDGEHSWTIIQSWPKTSDDNGHGHWLAISSKYGANMQDFATREDAKQACETRGREAA